MNENLKDCYKKYVEEFEKKLRNKYADFYNIST